MEAVVAALMLPSEVSARWNRRMTAKGGGPDDLRTRMVAIALCCVVFRLHIFMGCCILFLVNSSPTKAFQSPGRSPARTNPCLCRPSRLCDRCRSHGAVLDTR